jgi:hypothetical protein
MGFAEPVIRRAFAPAPVGPRTIKSREKPEDHKYRRKNFPALCLRGWFYGLLRTLLGEPMLVCHRRLAHAFGACTKPDASVGTSRLRRP